MADHEERQLLSIRVEGERPLREATAALEAQKKSISELIAFHKQGTITSAQFVAEMRREAATLRQLQGTVDRLAGASTGGIFGNASAAMRTQGLNQLSFAIQDFVSASGGIAQKLNSVTNNLQMFAMSLGLQGKIGLAITGGMVAIQALTTNMSALADWFNGVDREKLQADADKAKAAADKFKGLADTPTQQQSSTSDVWRKAITEAGADKLAKDVAEGMFRSPFGAKMTPEDVEAIKQAGTRRLLDSNEARGGNRWESKDAAAARANEVAKQVNDRLAAENAAAARKWIADASGTGPEADQARRNLDRMRRENPGAPTLRKFDPTTDMLNEQGRAAQKEFVDMKAAADKEWDEIKELSNKLWAEGQEAQRKADEQEKDRRADSNRKDWKAADRRREGLSKPVDLSKPVSTDAFEAQLLEAERASLELPAQADAMMGLFSEYGQRLAQVNQRLNLLYARNAQQQSGPIMGQNSALPIYRGVGY